MSKDAQEIRRESHATWDVLPQEPVHAGRCALGSIRIRQIGLGFDTETDQDWPIMEWRAEGDKVMLRGAARSLGRAKEDALAALRAVASIDFEGS